MTKSPVLLGAHLSIAGGIENAYFSAQSIGCTTVQFFTHSNRQWSMKPLSTETITAVHSAQKETGIHQAMVHASYLINLASTSEETRSKSKHMLQLELANCDELDIKILVLHPGTNPDLTTGISLIAEGINEVLASRSSKAMILLETMAGQGSQIGSCFEELAEIRQAINKKGRIGFCVDTCHLWASEYDFSTPKSYKALWEKFDSVLGLKDLKAIHLNDSKKACGTKVDRHTNIGAGTIGLEAFKLIMNDHNLSAVPKVLETPGKDPADYSENMKILLGLIT